MNTRTILSITPRTWQFLLAAALYVAVCAFASPGFAQTDTNSAAGGLGTGTNEASQFIQQAGQATVDKIQTLWQRIDEKRLKNRTPDQIVAWAIMGLLVGGLLYRFGKRGQVSSIILGLIGAFIGGIIANISKLDLGLGPVLITYEELLFTLLGGVLIICLARWSAIAKLFKPKVP